MSEQGKVKVRDAERTRRLVLDAAEQLFAERGFGGCTLKEIGELAGVSRGTPAYFFESKEQLYQAVLSRAFDRIDAVFATLRDSLPADGAGPERYLAEFVGGYVDFLAANPSFVRLVEWESRTGGDFLPRIAPHLAMIQEGLGLVNVQLASGSIRPMDPMQVLLSVMGLCWFPFSQADTLMRTLAQDPADPSFVEARKRHILDLLLNGLNAR
ncbi:MAG TPA: TetR/AcrR family transcriptional regulator [Stenomitos sp.]